MNTRLRWSVVVVILAVLATVALGPTGVSAASGSFERTLAVTGPVDLEVKTGSGSISVRTGEPGQVVVRGTIRSRDDDKVRALESNPPIQQDGNSIRIGHIEDRELRRNVSISYELLVPVETRLQSSTGSGRQSIQGVRGPAKVSTGSGNIKMSNIGDDLKATTGSGNITLDSVNAGVRATTGSGSIRATGIGGAFVATTGSGSVKLQQTTPADVEIRTGSGSVRVELPAEGGYDLYARTGSGGIHTEFPITVQGSLSRHELRGKVRGGGFRLRLRTGSGSIRIE